MNQRVYEITLRVWVVAALVVGAGLVGIQEPLLTTVGVILIILGLMSLLPIVRGYMTEQSAT